MTEAETPSIIVAGPLDGDAGAERARKWNYLPSLDGVRAIAVIAVVLFHFWPDTFPGGFVGVDVFFAMSGFLITGILHSEYSRSGRIDLKAFWGRRIRRLVPAVIVLVIVTALAAWLTDTGSFRQVADSIGALTWTTNLVEAWFGGTRVFLHNSRTTLDHLWSLAIEEQFYLVWPLVAALVLRRLKDRRAQVAVVLGLAALSALSMGLVGGVNAYFRTDTRAFELLAGAALALTGWAAAKRSPALTSALAVVGLAGLGLFVAFVSPLDDWMYPWGFLLISVCSVMVVAAAAHPAKWLSAILESRPMRHVGGVSYGIYLWHIPVYRLLSGKRMGFEGLGLLAVRLVVLVVLVEVSYRYVEEPFRQRRLRLGWRQVGIGYLAAGLALVPLISDVRDDFDGQWDAIDAPPRVQPGQERVLVTGDLIGASAASGLKDDDSLAVWSLADPGCPGLVGIDSMKDTEFLDDGVPLDIDEFCEHWPDRWVRGVAQFRPDTVVIGGGYWDTLELRKGPTDLQAAYEELIETQVRDAGGTAANRPEVILLRIDDWSDLVGARQRPLADRMAATATYNAAIDAVAARTPGVRVVEVSSLDGWDGLRTLSSSELR